MTTVQAPMRRSYSPEMFADITDAPIVEKTMGRPCWTLTFDADLDEPTVAAIWARMESTDDDDQAARANIRGLRDAVVAAPTLENVAALALAVADYEVGEAP